MLSFGPTQFPVYNTCLYNDVIVLTQIALLLIFGWGGGVGLEVKQFHLT